ncbi:hypothetical protein E2C01_042493 [Portunus trituberculatus]|uniref:Uncharacterized protein n=1 Tax=Portunus trituberculatus TaxID=210409 RepID=A0A5B7FLZ5_PORTR|nr:hypothetical protein [Portunus trituberculatus]
MQLVLVILILTQASFIPLFSGVMPLLFERFLTDFFYLLTGGSGSFRMRFIIVRFALVADICYSTPVNFCCSQKLVPTKSFWLFILFTCRIFISQLTNIRGFHIYITKLIFIL